MSLGHDAKPYNKQLSELRYSGVKTDAAPSLLEVIRWGGYKQQQQKQQTTTTKEYCDETFPNRY